MPRLKANFLREVPREVPCSPFEKLEKSLRKVPSVRYARARLVPPAPRRRERPCVVDLARCASALTRPTGAPRSIHSQNPARLCFRLRISPASTASAHSAAPGSPSVPAAPASSCADESTSCNRHAESKQRGDDSDGTSCTLPCKRTTAQPTLYVHRAPATTIPCHEARSRLAPPPWLPKDRLLPRSGLAPLLAAGPPGTLQTAPRWFPCRRFLASSSTACLSWLETEN